MKRSHRSAAPLALLVTLALAAGLTPLRAAVPATLNYQGRVAVDGVNFSGTGEFKFALVDGGGAVLWRNDGTVAAGEPATAVSLAVTNGLYSTLLGDTALANMAALPAGAFTGATSDVRLRVWFRHGGAAAFQQLAPDTRLAAAPFALAAQSAKTVDAGVFTSGLNGTGNFGTSDATPLTLRVNGQAVARFGIGDGTAHALGSSANTVNVFATGGTIAGGGSGTFPNNVGAIYGSVGGGLGNNSAAGYATIGGGSFNTAGGERSVVAGGSSNSAGGGTAAVGGGNNNSAGGSGAAIAGGSSNTASGDFTAVGGGFGNVASGTGATVPGGWVNTAGGAYSFAAGRRAKATHTGSFVWADSTDADFTSYTGNTFNIRASGGVVLAPGTKFVGFVDFSGASIGSASTTPVTFSVNGLVVGRLGLNDGYSLALGYNNSIAPGQDGSTIGGGYGTQVLSRLATVAGGTNHYVTGEWATVGGGTSHMAEGWCSTIGGGNSNKAAGNATVAGGLGNYATGGASMIPGGTFNEASGVGAMAAGQSARALHDNCFVWNDENLNSFESTGVRQFIIRARGGMGVNTNAPTATLHVNGTAKIQGVNNWDVTNTEGDFRVGNDTQRFKIGIATAGGGAGDVLMRAQGGTARVFFKAPGGVYFHSNEAGSAGVGLAAGGGSWTTISDRNAKENFTPVDALGVLAKVVALPLSTWNYKAQAAAIRHVGPMAQDFKAAFGVGETDTGIATVDADGVALAAIQGVNQKLEQEVAALRRELSARDAAQSALQRELAALRESVQALAAAQR